MACPKGTFFSRQSKKCEKCQRGSYQDKEGSMNCKPCLDEDMNEIPSGYGLHGATELKQCKGTCFNHFLNHSSHLNCTFVIYIIFWFRLSVCMYVCLSVCMYVCMSVCLYVVSTLLDNKWTDFQNLNGKSSSLMQNRAHQF